MKIIKGEKISIIESRGFVEKIQSSIIQNTIGVNLNEVKISLLMTKFDELQRKYNVKKLINEIYKQALNYNIGLDEFDISNLINNTLLENTVIQTININKNNPL